MKYCARCCYPQNTRPPMTFDEKGVCNGCRASEQRRNQPVNWEDKRNELKKILEHYKEIANKNETIRGSRGSCRCMSKCDKNVTRI